MKIQSSDLHLAIEPDQNRWRIVLLHGKEELACRLETNGHLNSFIESEDEMIFKGRIQLASRGSKVEVYFNKNLMGSVDKAEIRKAIG